MRSIWERFLSLFTTVSTVPGPERTAEFGGAASTMEKMEDLIDPRWRRYYELFYDAGVFKSVDGKFFDRNGKKYSREIQRNIKKNKAVPTILTEVARNKFIPYQDRNRSNAIEGNQERTRNREDTNDVTHQKTCQGCHEK